MAKPHYTICAQYASIDQTTNLVSAFAILDGFNIAISEPGATLPSGGSPSGSMMPFVCIAVWRREEGDSDEDDYEHESRLMVPGKGEFDGHKGKFRFTKPYHRFALHSALQIPGIESGLLIFESRIRKVGDADWLTQSYSIAVTVQQGTPDS